MYNHPYTPYDVQKRFMTTLYDTLNSPEKKVGIFESPTGTGKTLSLICPSIAWLRDRERRVLDEELEKLRVSKMPSWAIESAEKIKMKQFHDRGETLHSLMKEAQQALEQMKKPREADDFTGHRSKKQKLGDAEDDSKFVLKDVQDTELELLLEETNAASETDAEDKKLESLRSPCKIYFASRTHSQLSQLIDALRMIKVPAPWSENASEPARCVPLGSRKHLCINPKVSALSSHNQINEKCVELGSKCEFRDKHHVLKLRNNMLAGQQLDIEDLAKFGKSMAGCPYYASREAQQYAEIVTLPYPLLVQKSARDALGLDLSDSVVIIDEAHNIMDTVSSIHSSQCTLKSVSRAVDGLNAYYKKLGKRLSSTNRANIKQVMVLVNSLQQFFTSTKAGAPGTAVTSTDLFKYGQADTINLREMTTFVYQSKLTFKVDSYLQFHEERQSTLGQVLEFLLLASDPTAAGKLFWDRSESQEPCLKYLLLDPSPLFKEVVDQAKCVILAGGTMEPTDDYCKYLFPYLKPEQMTIFSCGHIVPKSSLLVQVVPGGATTDFLLTFANRQNESMILELGHSLLSIIHDVPDGVVTFFPGYKYLDSILAVWKKKGVLAQLAKIKPIFHEQSGDGTIFDKYAQCIKTGSGALLFAVVGGRLSEGINFSDSLARGVVMIGLPFPNAFSAEMIAKRAHIESVTLQTGGNQSEAKQQAREFYENIAMRAVNQSVGRSIRHAKDYAAIFLLDKRYQQSNIQLKLSKWVRESLSNKHIDTKSFFAAQHQTSLR